MKILFEKKKNIELKIIDFFLTIENLHYSQSHFSIIIELIEHFGIFVKIRSMDVSFC